MNKLEKLEEATILALQGKLIENNSKNNKLLKESDDEDLYEVAIECYYEGFDFATKDFIDSSIQSVTDYIKKVKSASEDYEDVKDDYLALEDYTETEILEELYKILKKEDPADHELTTHIEIVDDGDEPPHLYGYCDENISVYDRGDLSDDELWATGWTGIIQNISAGPYKSFEDITICCFDIEKDGEYNLPEIPGDIQEEFISTVNNWIEENPDYKD